MDSLAIVYDGECRFCLWSIGRIRRLDRRGRFECVPKQTPGVEQRFPGLRAPGGESGLRLVLASGEVRSGADAVHEIYRRLPPFHLVAWIYRVPLAHALLRAGYGLVARNRHRFGRVPCEACAPGAQREPGSVA